jgi:hypothetical protein
MEDRKIEFLRSHFELVESQVQFGDHKASLLVAGDAILLATCGGLIRMVSGCPRDVFAMSCMVPSVSLGLATIAATLLICSLFCALWATHPSGFGAKPPPMSMYFFPRHIADMEQEAFIKAFEDASYSDLVKEALKSIHGKAGLASKKFRLLGWAVRATLLSLGFIVLTLLVAVAPYLAA